MKRAFSIVFLVLAAGCYELEPLRKTIADIGVREKVGVLAHLDITWPNSTRALRRALAFFRAEEATKIIVLGDPTKNGYPNQREVFEQAWKESFRGVTPPELVLAGNAFTFRGITFTNDGHFPLTDLICVQPRDGRTINAGSMHGIAVSGIFGKLDSRMTGAVMASAQGLFVIARDDGLTVRRMDFNGAAAEDVGEPWRVDAAGMIIAEESVPPRFWEDTVISVVPGYDAKGNAVYTVRWPAVLAKFTGVRAFSYEVQVEGKVIRDVQSPGFYLPESRDGAPLSCTISAGELGDRQPRFGVTPISSLGLAGPTVWSN